MCLKTRLYAKIGGEGYSCYGWIYVVFLIAFGVSVGM
jgi:hypothetical protein